MKIERIIEMVRNVEKSYKEMVAEELEEFGFSHCDNNGNLDMCESWYKAQLGNILEIADKNGICDDELLNISRDFEMVIYC